VKALTVKQPWAWAIAHGLKSIENRSRPTKHRGPLAIHAGAAWDRAGAVSPTVIAAARSYRYPLQYGKPLDATEGWFQFRAVIALVDVVDCHRDTGCCRPWGMEGAWHWVLVNPRQLDEPVPAAGRLGLWDIGLPTTT
jgi:hypothetical protein